MSPTVTGTDHRSLYGRDEVLFTLKTQGGSDPGGPYPESLDNN